MQAIRTGSGRREERVPLEALIELRTEGSDELREADGLNVSIGGVAMRAAAVPPLGASIACRFACPPDGEPISAQGEVVWATPGSAGPGRFGVRFVALDTKSATALRRYLGPQHEQDAKRTRLRSAVIRIDGVETSLEAELKLADESRVVLEQELAFLQLGRGVEVSLEGRGKERGRIASVELRRSSQLDVPTIVYGVLLDGAPSRAPENADGAARATPLFAGDQRAAARTSEVPASARSSAVDTSEVSASARSSAVDLPRAAPESPPAQPVGSASASVEPRELPSHAAEGTRDAQEDDLHDEGDEPDPPRGMRGSIGRLWAELGLLARALLLRLRALTRQVEPALREQAESLDLPDKRTRFLLQLARLRALALRLWTRMGGGEAAARRPALRMQRSTLPGIGPAESDRDSPRRIHILAGVLAAIAIALGVYAVAPRSGADLKLPSPEAPPTVASDEPVEMDIEEAVTAAEPAATSARAPAQAEPSIEDDELEAELEAESSSVPAAAIGEPTAMIGDPDVPNGRVFTLRMNGPVARVQAIEQREDGFVVRVPGRVSVDRAGPIASQHKSVARAMIINERKRGYAELTIDFRPGPTPRYRVRGKHNTLEITLERL